MQSKYMSHKNHPESDSNAEKTIQKCLSWWLLK